MNTDVDPRLRRHMAALRRLTRELAAGHARSVLLFGSTARRLIGSRQDRVPADLDIIAVTNNYFPPPAEQAYGLPVQLHRFRIERMIALAAMLRYDPKPVILARLYGHNVIQGHARRVIAACLLLGPDYPEFGIQQIDIDGRADTRDYSVHQVMHGHEWWARLTAFARERRGPIKRLSDRLTGLDQFRP